MQVRETNLFEKEMVVDDVKGFAKVDAEKACPDGRFLLVEAPDNVSRQREQRVTVEWRGLKPC